MKIIGIAPSTVRLSLGLGLWGVATWLVLSLHDAPIAQTHSICGPWGCGPTIPALLAAHEFWLLVAIPAACWVGLSFPKRWSVALGRLCLGLGFAGIVAVASGELLHRPKSAPRQTDTYPIERAFFTLATTVQVPLFPTVIAGLILLLAGRRRFQSPDLIESGSSDQATDGCTDRLCNPPDVLPANPKATRVEVGKLMPTLMLSFVISEPRTFQCSNSPNQKSSLVPRLGAGGRDQTRGAEVDGNTGLFAVELLSSQVETWIEARQL